MNVPLSPAAAKEAGRFFDSRAWLIWVLATAVLVTVARNPLYTLILLLVVRLVTAAWGNAHATLPLPFWRVGALILALSTAINVLFVNSGATVMGRLPDAWPLIGGPLTLEAAVYGAHNGLILLALLATFLALNGVVPAADLVRLAPRAFYSLAVVLLITLTYVPETVRHLKRVREAQAIRGHRLRGLRDWRPLLMPLLIGGLERAMQLAETMVARGYGATGGKEQPAAVRLALLGSLVALLAGWLLALWWGWPGYLLLLAGAAALVSLIRQLGRSARHTVYRPFRWHRQDTLLFMSAVLPLLLFLVPWPLLDHTTLFYSPYPALSLPPFDPILGVALAGLALPALLAQPAAQPGAVDQVVSEYD
jgi:energy-coupling factor transport system permease protein